MTEPRHMLGLREDLASRLKLAMVAVPLFVLSGFAMWKIITNTPKTPRSFFQVMGKIVVFEAVLALLIVTSLATLWVVATPQWIPRLLDRWATRLFLTFLLSILLLGLHLWLTW